MTYIQNNPLSRRKSSPCNANGDDKTISEVREEPGSSNAGKYPGVTKFCGPAGGAAKGTYPVEKDGKLDAGRISAAKSYADNAPDPAGIRACADRYEAQLKGEGEGHLSRRSSSPANHLEKEGEKHPPANKAHREQHAVDNYEGQKQRRAGKKAVSRRSSSPLNKNPNQPKPQAKKKDCPEGWTLSESGTCKPSRREPEPPSRRSSSPVNAKCPEGYKANPDKNSNKTCIKIQGAENPAHPKKGEKALSRRSSSPVNYSGLPGVNEDDILTDIESGRGESNWQAHHGDKKGVAPSRHGSMTGDQSAKSDYANFKDTDPNYHGHDGESHEDQSATRRDYMGNMGRHHIDPRTKK